MSHISQINFAVFGADPDTKASGLALVTAQLPLGEVALQDIKVRGVRSVMAEGMDARRRLPGIVEALLSPIEELMNEVGQVDLIVVEGAAHRKDDPRPDNIVQLAVVQGAIAAAALGIEHEHGTSLGDPSLRMPLPVDWKGSKPKSVHHEELRHRLHLSQNLAGVPGSIDILKSKIIHVMDAIGLAVWGLEKLAFEERKNRVLR